MEKQSFTTREVVRWFAEQMEVRLKENDHKGGWQNCRNTWLMGRLLEEFVELQKAVDECNRAPADDPLLPMARLNVLREAADVANFAMMVADVTKE